MPKGYPKDPEMARRKRSASLTGRVFSVEHCANISRSQRRRFTDPRERDKMHSPERSRRISLALSGRPKTVEHRKKLSESLLGHKNTPTGDSNPARRPEVRAKMVLAQRRRYVGHHFKTECPMCGKAFMIFLADSLRGRRFCSRECSIKWWSGQMHTEEYLRRCIFIPMMLAPNKIEKRLTSIIEKFRLPYRYCGDGEVIIGGLNPDFININGQKQLIEVFGDYWHKDSPSTPPHRRKKNRCAIFARYGFRMLVLWEHEINSLSEEEICKRIQDFK